MILKILNDFQKETSCSVFFSGKYVRDVIRKKSPEYVEIVVRRKPLKSIINYFEKIGKVSKAGKNKIIFTSRKKHLPLKITIPKKGNSYSPYFTLYDHACSSDFTINAMYFPLKSRKTKNVIDYFNGLKCIKNRIIETVLDPKKSIRKNPEQVLSSVVLAAETGYKIDKNLFYTIKANSNLIEKLPIKYVRSELVKILLSNSPSKYIKILYNLNLLGYIMPELITCMGVMQNSRYHKYDVFTHCVYACDNTEPNLILRLSALLHDIGKPHTAREIVNQDGNRKITFYNHEVIGAKIAKRILKRLRFNDEIVKKVSKLVYLHMYNYEPDIWTDSAVRRFIEKAELTEKDLDDLPNLPLFLLRKADRLSNGHPLKAVSRRQTLFEKRIKEVFNKSYEVTLSDLAINGSTLIDEFNLEPGTTIGHLLNYALFLVKQNPRLNTRQNLIRHISDYLSNVLQ